MKRFIVILVVLCMISTPAMASLFTDNSVEYDQDQKQQQAQLQHQDQDQKQKQGQVALAVQGQGQVGVNKNKNEGNQGQANVNIHEDYDEQLQFPMHVGLQAAYGTDTAQLSIGGLTLSDTAPHVIAQTKMTILSVAGEAGILTSDEVRAEVLMMLDQLNVQTRPKRIFGWGPRTSGKHLFNLFGIIATDSYRGNNPEEPVTSE